ncbi:MAG: Cfr10I/Bse634I family restriction endonuclease [Sulfitobacter sp.]
MHLVTHSPTKKKPKRPKISLSTTFLAGLGKKRPKDVGDFEAFFTVCESLVLADCKRKGLDEPDSGAFGRGRGQWYEWLFAIGGLDYVASNTSSKSFLIQLPDKDRFDYLELYNDEVYRYFAELRQMLQSEDVTLISSNPDFAIVRKRDKIALPQLYPLDGNLLDQLARMYKSYVHQFDFDEFIGFASVKTTFRPDRILQLPAEAAMVKAYYEHLKARMWKLNSSGLIYNAVSMQHSKADLKTLKTAAIHSILSVNTKPEKAVDKVVIVANSAEMLDFFDDALQ